MGTLRVGNASIVGEKEIMKKSRHPAPLADEKSEKPLTASQQREALMLICCLLDNGHDLIVSAIEGKPLDANRLENYYGTWTELLIEIGYRGCLIDREVTDSLERRWPVAKASSPRKEAK